MLEDFLRTNRDELIARCRAKVAQRPAPRPTEKELRYGIPLFLDQLIRLHWQQRRLRIKQIRCELLRDKPHGGRRLVVLQRLRRGLAQRLPHRRLLLRLRLRVQRFEYLVLVRPIEIRVAP